MALLLAACAPNTPPVTGIPRDNPTVTPAPIDAAQSTAAQPQPQATATIEAVPTSAQTEALPLVADTLPKLALQKLVDGLGPLTYLTYAGDGSGRLYVTEQPGRIKVIENGRARDAAFLDITDRVGSQGNEQGLLSIAFSPNFAQNRLVYVNYTDRRGTTVVSRFVASADGLSADPASEQIVLTIDQPYSNHNGGQLKFGPDGMLYIGMGDGGAAGDPQNYAQNVQSLLGKMLRIDVSRTDGDRLYAIPADNPNFGPNASQELWAIGLRNPWRFSFDRATGDLYIADVGQNAWEEINFQPASSRGGENYGWRLREGFAPYRGGAESPAFTPPVYQYGHDLGCSVTGGYVYRGAAIPGLAGRYLYADFCSGTIWALYRGAGGQWVNETVLQ
ncbi:MAG: PQQ-dependent sugar dehydrogenase, partial [Candidatus Roseilinea sp.]|uniref:PQQ-dependent sugar dehydrogenase n=1 Tax=Candidatus Roseilinea sp. TaxID=2838777 RepID=UPI0040494300